MFIPLRTDRSLRHTPWVNYALILVNVICFIAINPDRSPELTRDLMLWPVAPQLHQFITYQFMHADWMHLLGNMLFLYVFGNSLEDRLGKIGYLAFYLAGGVIAGLGFAMLENNPVLGASGSVAAVTGAFLALFPMTNVTLLFFFIFISTFQVSSMLLILFQIGQDLLMYMINRDGGVAYLAHISGYAFGFLVGMGLLWLRLLAREPYDLLSMLEQRRRRAQFRSMTSKGYHPWDHAGSRYQPGRAEPVQLTEKELQIMDIRSRISQAAANHDFTTASQLYKQLIAVDPDQVMPPRLQLDIANHMTAHGDHAYAAGAYELYLNTFKDNPHDREQVELMLGLIYARYLNRWQRAKELLTSAGARTTDPNLKALVQQTLADISTPRA
jgi:membrane associated rhomboid family serine protease